MGPRGQNDNSADKKGLGDKLGWFPFPSIAGGAGAATDGVGGGNGIAVKKDAPPEAVDFLKFFVNTDNGNKLNTSGIGSVAGQRHRQLDHGPEPPGRPGWSRPGQVYPAVPRPGRAAIRRRRGERCDSQTNSANSRIVMSSPQPTLMISGES